MRFPSHDPDADQTLLPSIFTEVIKRYTATKNYTSTRYAYVFEGAEKSHLHLHLYIDYGTSKKRLDTYRRSVRRFVSKQKLKHFNEKITVNVDKSQNEVYLLQNYFTKEKKPVMVNISLEEIKNSTRIKNLENKKKSYKLKKLDRTICYVLMEEWYSNLSEEEAKVCTYKEFVNYLKEENYDISWIIFNNRNCEKLFKYVIRSELFSELQL